MRYMQDRLKKLTMVGMAGIFIVSMAYGEEEKTLELGTMTVTANKREEKIKDVPASISAFSETDLDDAGIKEVNDIVEMVPGLNIEKGVHGNEVNFRGMRPSPFTQKNPVVLYIDGVPCDAPTVFDADFNNVERVEVLRGPQGTLYGKNTLGGVINVVSKKPGNTVEGKVSVEVGDYGKTGIRAFVNGPVVEDLFYFGFSGSLDQKQGFIKNDHPDQDYVDGEKTSRAKATFRWTPSARLEINLNTGTTQKRENGGMMIPGEDIVFHAYRNPDDYIDTDIINSSLDINYQGEDIVFKSITTYRSTKFDFTMDYGIIHPMYKDMINKTEQNNITQEFRLQSPDGDTAFNWVGGLYFSNDKKTYDDMSATYNYKALYGYNIKYNWPDDLAENTQAIFGQFTKTIADRFDFTGGLRYETIHKEMDFVQEITRVDTGAAVSPRVTYHTAEDWTALLPKAVLSWKSSPDVMMYFSIADGYLPGGFNTTETNKEKAKFDAQTSRNYEVGTKTSLLNNKMMLNVAVYHIDIKDMHVYSVPAPGIYLASNAGKAHSQGVEMDMVIMPAAGLKLSAQLSKIDSKFDDYQEYDGNTTTQTPEYTTNLAIQYRDPSGIYAQAEVLNHGKTYYTDSNSVYQDPYQLINTKIGYERSFWDVYLQVKNLADTKYAQAYSPDFDSLAFFHPGVPRSVSVVASARF